MCRWHSALLLFPPTQLWLEHFAPSKLSSTHLFLDECGSSNFNSYKTEFLLIGLKNQLAKIRNISLDTSHSARNLGFIFDEHLTFSDQITYLSKACYYHIRQHHRIWPYLDSSTACTIATSIIHSKLDYYYSLYCKLPESQLFHFQRIQNSLVVKAPKSCHITPILRSLHWLRITERVEYKLLLLTYKVLTTTQPPYLHKLIFVQRPRSTRSSSVVTFARPPSPSFLIITDRSFRYASPCLCNQLSLYLFINLILVPVPPFPTHPSIHPSLLPLLIRHFSHLLLPLSSLPA